MTDRGLERGGSFFPPQVSVPGQMEWADLGLPAGSQGATRKYKVWMRHRYRSCLNRLQELLVHSSFEVKVSPLTSPEVPAPGCPQARTRG